jgi:triosephosphate isomerase
MRKKIVAGNWKMNNNLVQTKALLSELLNRDLDNGVEVIVAPSFTNLQAASLMLENTSIALAAQNMHHIESGAYTGEVSASMLTSVGTRYVILGHSERRAYFKENSPLLAEKVKTALANDLDVIFCFGEELADRQAGRHFDLVASQLRDALFQLPADAWSKVILAYEPVWAIGTGETATPEQAQEMHAFIRKTLADAYSAGLANEVSILYGGSVKPANAAEIFAKPDVDGGLIGGASLDADQFADIVNAFSA